jgi:hypothetical protein
MNDENTIDKDWPADPDNAELLLLADQLANAAAPLPPEALARVQAQMQAAIERGERWRRRGRWALGWSIAAGIIIAVVGYLALRSGPEPQTAKAPDPSPVQDRIVIAVGDTTAPTLGKPLIALDDYRSLFAD